MSPVKIPEPTPQTAELIEKLDRAIELFRDARTRRDEAKKQADAAKFRRGDLERNAPRTAFSDIKSEARHAQDVKDAQAKLDQTMEIFLQLNREVAQAAISVDELQKAVSHSTRLELEPVQRAAQKQVEVAVDALLAAIDTACALNRVLGTGQSYVWPKVPCPTSGTDLAYRRERAAAAVPADWLKYQQQRSHAMDVARELPPAQAAE